MNIIIRTDASIEIGTGHVMRCLTLAKQLEREGATITFVCRKLKGNSIRYIESEGFKVFTLHNVKKNSDNLEITKENWLLDARETISLLSKIEVSLIIVDHYSLDSRWEKEIRNITNKVLVIDDLANRPHECDFLLDQNYYANMNKRYSGLVPQHCVLMLGPNYALLREEFMEVAKTHRKRTGKVDNLIIFFGGIDPTGETIKALRSVKKSNIIFSNIDVVVGFANPYKEQIQKLCMETLNAHYHCQINNMAELMMRADLSIGSGGSTIWERCILGLPALVYVIADNQREVTGAVNNQGSLICIGEAISVSEQEIKDGLVYLMKNPTRVKAMHHECNNLINSDSVKDHIVKRNQIILQLKDL